MLDKKHVETPDNVRPPGTTKWWLWAILSPIAGIVLGIFIAMSLGQRQDDWLGMRAAVPIMFGLLAGCVSCCVFTLVSLGKNEKRSTYAFIAAIPSGLFVAFAILTVFDHLHGK